jgi:hypothetical protein
MNHKLGCVRSRGNELPTNELNSAECVSAMERLGLIGPTAAQGAPRGGTQVTLVSPHVQLFPLDANARSGGERPLVDACGFDV